MVEVSFENIVPVAGLLAIGIAAYGAARRFTTMEKDIANDQQKNDHDIAILEDRMKRLQIQVDSIRHDVKEMHTILTKLNQRVEDKLNQK